MVAYIFALLFGSAFAAPTTDAERKDAIDRLYAKHAASFSEVKAITPGELKERLASGEQPLLVDVRPAEERNISTIPGAISLETFQSMGQPERQVVLFCTLGVRSGHEAHKLQKKGWDVLNLQGSLLGWSFVGGPLVTPKGEPTRRVHVYSKDWDFLSSDYESVVTDGGVVSVLRAATQE